MDVHERETAAPMRAKGPRTTAKDRLMSTTPEPPPIDSIFTIDEAARYLSIPKATLYTWRTRRVGYGPRAMKVGGSLRYRRFDLDAWILAHLENVDDGYPETESMRGKALNANVGVAMTRRRPST